MNEETGEAAPAGAPVQKDPENFALPNMSDIRISRSIAAPPEIRLKRFLHYGSEEAVYTPSRKDFKAKVKSDKDDKVKSIDALKVKSIDALIEKGKVIDPVNHIVKVSKFNYFLIFTCGMFLLWCVF